MNLCFCDSGWQILDWNIGRTCYKPNQCWLNTLYRVDHHSGQLWFELDTSSRNTEHRKEQCKKYTRKCHFVMIHFNCFFGRFAFHECDESAAWLDWGEEGEEYTFMRSRCSVSNDLSTNDLPESLEDLLEVLLIEGVRDLTHKYLHWI